MKTAFSLSPSPPSLTKGTSSMSRQSHRSAQAARQTPSPSGLGSRKPGGWKPGMECRVGLSSLLRVWRPHVAVSLCASVSSPPFFQGPSPIAPGPYHPLNTPPSGAGPLRGWGLGLQCEFGVQSIHTRPHGDQSPVAPQTSLPPWSWHHRRTGTPGLFLRKQLAVSTADETRATGRWESSQPT